MVDQSPVGVSFQRIDDAMKAAILAALAPAMTKAAVLVAPLSVPFALILVAFGGGFLLTAGVYVLLAAGMRQVMTSMASHQTIDHVTDSYDPYMMTMQPPVSPSEPCHCTNCINRVSRGDHAQVSDLR